MSQLFSNVGFAVDMLCECAQHFHPYYTQVHQGADVTSDVRLRPWDRWRQQGWLAVVLAAGFSCQPFSGAGKQLQEKDCRSSDAVFVCEAVALKSICVFLENVPKFVDDDSKHGLFTKLCRLFTAAGYSLVRVIRVRHHMCGGHTYRSRVLMVFLMDSYSSSVDVSCIMKLSCSVEKPALPRQLTYDRARDWASYGTVSSSSKGLQLAFTTSAVVPGVVVAARGSAQLWRVQQLQAGQVKLMCTNRRRSTVEWRPLSDLRPVASEHSVYPVSDPDQVMPTIIAWGEPPGRGAPLVRDGPHVLVRKICGYPILSYPILS